MTVTIELSDEQAAQLKALAEAEGLTIQTWLHRLATHPSLISKSSLLAEMRKIRSRVKPDPEGWTARDYVIYGRR